MTSTRFFAFIQTVATVIFVVAVVFIPVEADETRHTAIILLAICAATTAILQSILEAVKELKR